MAIPTTKAFVPNFNNEVDIESMITAPLVAASKANVVMATGQQRFLLDFCFDKNEDDDTYVPKLVKMVMTKGVIDPDIPEGEPGFIKEVKLVFSVPLLCIIPFNSLAVQEVSIDFGIELTSATSEKTVTSENEIIERKAHLRGRMTDSEPGSDSVRRNQRQKSSTLKLNLVAGSLPLSNGLLLILDLYTKAIQPFAADGD